MNKPFMQDPWEPPMNKCGCCPETPGVLECAIGCKCDCHHLREQINELEATVDRLTTELDKAVGWGNKYAQLEARCSKMEDKATTATLRAMKAERERDDAMAACQQKHGVHYSWVNEATKARAQAFEEAAEIARSYTECDAGGRIAVAIRAKAKEGT